MFSQTLLWLTIHLFYCFIQISCSLNPKLTKVWGPGLEPHKIVMPARYFFIKPIDNNNQSIIQSLQHPLDIKLIGKRADNKTSCRIWFNLLDTKNGVYIIRYKVYDECFSIRLELKYLNQHIANSPYVINQNVYPDSAYCPQQKLSDFLHTWECQAVPQQIINDFKPFNEINWDIIRPKIIQEFNKPHSVSLCHYIIKSNKIYRKCYGKYVGFNMFSDSILLSLARKAILPDVELFINLGDWPLSTKYLKESYPIFSWCSSIEANDIVMPTYELTESTLENMGRVMLDIFSAQGNVESVWEQRQSKLFWRGRDSNRHRLDLINLSRNNPNLFNASLTNFFFFKNEEDVYGPATERVSFFRFFDYKYQLSIDGTVADYRFPFLLAGGSLIFKQKSKYYEHFYDQLKPNVHYVPVKEDLSDLVEKIQWAIDNDDKAKTIAKNGQTFANDQLLPKNVFCYYLHLLSQLNKVTSSPVEVLEDMEEVIQKNDVYSCSKKSANNIKETKDEL